MTEKHHVALDRARKAAKALARSGGMTHQQALDRIARDAGHAHWSAMASATPGTTVPVPLLAGPAAAPEAPAPQRGPTRPFFEMDEFRFLEGPRSPPAPTLASVEADASRLMARVAGRPGDRIGEWIGRIMREAAARAEPAPDAPYVHGIRPLPLDARMVAQAVDPAGGPWPDSERLTVRCPLHPDGAPSLTVGGTGTGIGVRCMAGCDDSKVQDRVLEGVLAAEAAATAFMRANDRSRVVEGVGLGPEGVGGMGAFYRTEDGGEHELGPLATRMLPDGYPAWSDGRRRPRGIAALERGLRTALAGRFPIAVAAAEDRAHGTWRFEIDAGHRYRILVTRRQGEQPGVNAGFSGSFSVDAAESHVDVASAVRRVLGLLRRAETLDPVERSHNEVRHQREVARNERLRGTVNGWGWWVGPDEQEFSWGGPWKTRAEAISQGNGSCHEDGETFYVVQARTGDVDPEPGEMTPFLETRGLKRCRAT